VNKLELRVKDIEHFLGGNSQMVVDRFHGEEEEKKSEPYQGIDSLDITLKKK